MKKPYVLLYPKEPLNHELQGQNHTAVKESLKPDQNALHPGIRPAAHRKAAPDQMSCGRNHRNANQLQPAADQAATVLEPGEKEDTVIDHGPADQPLISERTNADREAASKASDQKASDQKASEQKDELDECSLIRDLLPKIAEGSASKQSMEAAARHIAYCPACAAALKRLQTQMDQAPVIEPEQLNAFGLMNQKIRRMRWLCLGFALLCVLISAFALRHGSASSLLSPEAISSDVLQQEQSTTILLRPVSLDTVLEKPSYSLKDGILSVQVSAHHGKASLDQVQELSIQQPFDTIELNEQIIWQNGIPISLPARSLFTCYEQASGSLQQAAAKALDILQMSRWYGSYDFSVESSDTVAELSFAQDLPSYVHKSESTMKNVRAQMQRQSSLLLGMFDSLKKVHFVFPDWEETFSRTDQILPSVSSLSGMELALQMCHLQEGEVLSYVQAADLICYELINQTNRTFIQLDYTFTVNGTDTFEGSYSAFSLGPDMIRDVIQNQLYSLDDYGEVRTLQASLALKDTNGKTLQIPAFDVDSADDVIQIELSAPSASDQFE